MNCAGLLLALACVVGQCLAFNLDDKFPLSFRSPEEDDISFGVSVLLQADSTAKTKPWIQIGAPSPNKQPGGRVYRCPIGSPCKRLNFPKIPEGNETYFDDFVGGAMASQSASRPGTVVVCGSRWHAANPSHGTYHFTGACNRMEPAEPAVNTHEVGKWFAPLHKSSVIFCEPGQLSSGKASLSWPPCSVPETDSSEFAYLGYQVTSGEFFKGKERLLAAGAPRGGNLYGMVRVYKLPFDKNPLKLVTSQTGVELGSYFGASLAAGDFNGDKRDDLAVGAPLSTSSSGVPDAGAVHQFLGMSGNTVFNKPSGGPLQGRAPGGRFGQTLACPGDLNKDGYADLVVGAPYEDDGLGAVYVFNGGPNGLELAHSQRIAPRDMGSSVKGFGISLSPAVDIDGNKYLDLAVGSYGEVLLLRSHPVVELRMTVSSHLKRVPQNATRVKISACIAFQGVDAPSELDVIRTVEVSSDLDVARLEDPKNTGQQQKTMTSNIHLKNATTCKNLTIHIKAGSKYQDVIVVHASVRLDMKVLDSEKSKVINGENSIGDNFDKNSPVERRRMEPTTLRLEFENECKNQKCIADLGLSFEFQHDLVRTEKHVVGSLKQLQLVVGVTNQGEPAYRTRIKVTLPLSMALANVPSNCELNDMTLTCNIGDLTPERSSGSLRLSLDMSSVLEVGEGSLRFNISTHTISDQLGDDKHTTARLTLDRDARLAIYGKPVGRASYRYASGNETAQQVDFAHEFSVDKMGESPIDDAVIRMRYPFGWASHGGGLVFAWQPEVNQDGQSLTCTSTETYLKETSDTEGMDSDSDVRTKRETSPSGGEPIEPPANETFFLHCDIDGVLCANISCKARPFLEDTTVRMVVRMRVDIAAMSDLLGGKRIVSLSTFGDVLWDGEKMRSHVNSTTHFIGATEVKEVENWIIALSIGGGLLLFVFLVMGLIKVGFFQRKQKMEMEAIIEQEEEIKAFRQSQMLEGNGLEDLEE